MAHFAKIGVDNIVLKVVCFDDTHTSTEGGIEKESLGKTWLEEQTGHETWVQCSFHTIENTHTNGKTPLRANYPGPGWYYDSTNDIFHPPRPVDDDGDIMNSWTVNTTTGVWEPPITKPSSEPTEDERNAASGDDLRWIWDESLYQSDNTKGWVLKTT